MTPSFIVKFIAGIFSICVGVYWIRRRYISVTTEGSDEELYPIKGWDAVLVGCGFVAFGVALVLDAFGIVLWTGV